MMAGVHLTAVVLGIVAEWRPIAMTGPPGV
jgi:hypothetical protein